MKHVVEWEGPFEKYSAGVIRKNMWRFWGMHEFDDLLQEAACVFYEVRRDYANKVDSPQHLMAIFKTALFRKVVYDMSQKARKKKDRELTECMIPDLVGEAGQHSPTIRAASFSKLERVAMQGDFNPYPSSHMSVLLKEAPKQVRQVFSLLTSMTTEVATVIETAQKAQRRACFNNKHLCDLLGYDSSEIDLVGMCQEYMLQAE